MTGIQSKKDLNSFLAARDHQVKWPAMHLLQSGVDLTEVALWLGHESTTTTHGYATSDMRLKEEALGRLQPLTGRNASYRPSDQVLAFLESL